MIKSYARLFILSSALTCSVTAQAFTAIEFGSPFDHFTLKKSGSRYLLKDQVVDPTSFKDFLPLFAQSFTGSCARISKLKPDLTMKLNSQPPAAAAPPEAPEIAAITDDGSLAEAPKVADAPLPPPTRHFYIRERIASDGKNCASVSGEGIYYLPLHSSWFDKNKGGSIAVGSSLSLEKKGKVFAKIKKVDGDWVDDAEGQFLNWEFIEAFVKSLDSFAVDLRLHPSAGDKKPSFTLITPNDKYTFYKVGNNLWGAKGSKSGWLLSSKSWAFWQSMDENIWANPFEAQLKIVFDKTKPIEERTKTLGSLDNIWNNSMKRSFHQLMLDPEQEQKLKDVTLQILKKKPSIENMAIMIKALQESQSVEFQSDLTKALRVRNPKGPILQPEDEPEKRAETVKAWTQWWQQIEKAR